MLITTKKRSEVCKKNRCSKQLGIFVCFLALFVGTLYSQGKFDDKDQTFYSFDDNSIHFFQIRDTQLPVYVTNYNVRAMDPSLTKIEDVTFDRQLHQLYIATADSIYFFSSLETGRRNQKLKLLKFYNFTDFVSGEKIINLSFATKNRSSFLSVATQKKVVVFSGISLNTEKYDEDDNTLVKTTFIDTKHRNIKQTFLSYDASVVCLCYNSSNIALTQWLNNNNGIYKKEYKQIYFSIADYNPYLSTISSENFLVQVVSANSVMTRDLGKNSKLKILSNAAAIASATGSAKEKLYDHYLKVFSRGTGNFYAANSVNQTDPIFIGLLKDSDLRVSKIAVSDSGKEIAVVLSSGEITILKRDLSPDSSNLYQNFAEGKKFKIDSANIAEIFFINNSNNLVYWTKNLGITVMNKTSNGSYSKKTTLAQVTGKNISARGGGKLTLN